MAEVGSIDVAIRATTEGLSSGLEACRELLEGSGKSLAAAAAVVGAGIAAGIGESLKLFAEAERSATGLAVALRNSGDASKEALSSMLDFDLALSQMSRFTKEEIQEAQTFLATQGLKGEALKRATQASVDLGTQTGNLTMAARLLGNAYEGAGTGLRRYGIILAQGTPPAMMFSDAMTQIEQKFGGRAAADAETLGGQVSNLTKIFSEFGENIGGVLAHSVKDMVHFLLDNKEKLLKMGDDIGVAIINVVNHLIDFVNFWNNNKSLFKGIADIASSLNFGGLGTMPFKLAGSALIGLGGFGVDMYHKISGTSASPNANDIPHLSTSGRSTDAGSAVTNQSERTAQGLYMFGNGGGGKSNSPSQFALQWQAAMNKTQGIVTDGDGKITNNFERMVAKISGIMKGFQSSLSSGFMQFFQGILTGGENLGQALMHIADSLLNFVLSTLSEMLAEWITKHVVMAAISSMFNLNVVKDTAVSGVAQVAVSKATYLAMIPGIIGVTNAELIAAYAGIPFAGPGLAAAAIGVADAQIAGYASLIAAADGGIFTGPTPVLAGEAGREAILPLTGSRGKSALREIGAGATGGGDGSGVHIHLHGNLIEGSAASWERLTRNVIIPALEKSGRKTSRTRGTSW